MGVAELSRVLEDFRRLLLGARVVALLEGVRVSDGCRLGRTLGVRPRRPREACSFLETESERLVGLELRASALTEAERLLGLASALFFFCATLLARRFLVSSETDFPRFLRGVFDRGRRCFCCLSDSS